MLAQIVTLREIVAMWNSSSRLCGIFTVFLSVTGVAANSDERERFVAAEQALADGRLATYQQLAGQLKDYPLYPYLVFAEAERATAVDAAVESGSQPRRHR